MLKPACQALEVWRNGVFPLDEWRMVVDGDPLDLTAAVVELQVRLYEGAPSSPLIDCSSEDVSGDRIEVTSAADGRFLIHIAETSFEALPAPTYRNDPLRLRWDLRIDTGAGFDVYAYGDFVVHTGVTQ